MLKTRLLALCLSACLGSPALAEPADELLPSTTPLSTERFAGTWFVQASIPVKVPFFKDGDAYNYVQRFEPVNKSKGNNTARLVSEFNRGSFAGKLKRATVKAFPDKKRSNTRWKVQPIWPVRMTYLVLYVDDDYSTTFVGVPDRRWGWLMTREPHISPEHYTSLLSIAGEFGYDVEKFRRIPHDQEPMGSALNDKPR